MRTMVYSDTLIVEVCIECGVGFAWPQNLRQFRLDHRHEPANRRFFCPNGHAQWFIGKTDADLERDRRIRAEAALAREQDRLEVARRQTAAAKGQVTKIKNRVKNGVCPFCKRTFANVAAHMETQHAHEKVTK